MTPSVTQLLANPYVTHVLMQNPEFEHVDFTAMPYGLAEVPSSPMFSEIECVSNFLFALKLVSKFLRYLHF